jgi:protein TonB
MRNNFIPFIIAVLIHGFIFIPMFLRQKESTPAPAISPRETLNTIDLSTFSVKRGAPAKTSKGPGTRTTNQVASTGSTTSSPSTPPTQTAGNAIAFINAPDPVYPRLAREKNIEGKVKLKAWYNEQGHVIKVEVTESSGKTMLDNASLETLKKWTLNAKSPGDFEKTFEFKLKN